MKKREKLFKQDCSTDKNGHDHANKTKPDRNFQARIKLYIIIALVAIYMIALPIYQAVLGDSVEIGNIAAVQLSGEDWNADQYIKSGISANEQKYTWSNGKTLEFYSFRGATGDYDMTVTVREIFHETQTVKVLLNGTEIENETLQYLPDGQEQEVHVLLHMTTGRNKIELQFPDAITPKNVTGADDDRELAVQLVRVLFEKKTD